MSVEAIQTLYDKAIANEKIIHKDLSEEDQQTRAIIVVGLALRKQLKSPAIGFDGMILADSGKRDTIEKLKKSAMKVYIENPQEAIAQGLTNEEGYPLDPRPTWSTGRANPGFGKLLPENSWIRTIHGIALKSSTEGEPKFFTMTLNGDVAANDDIPMYTPVTFRAIDKSTEGATQLTLNASTYTRFDKSDKKLPSATELISQYCSDMILDISKLEEYHKANKNDYNRLVIIRGDVSILALEPNSIGNRRLTLESENAFEDLDAIGTTCWIPEHINLDFAENSKVIVIGSTSQGFKYENGAKTEELGDVMINAYGVHAIPEYKVQIDVEEITEESIVTETEPVVNTTEHKPEATTW
jgi:hypothetical protein